MCPILDGYIYTYIRTYKVHINMCPILDGYIYIYICINNILCNANTRLLSSPLLRSTLQQPHPLQFPKLYA